MEMNRLTREADELIRRIVARYNSLYSPSGSVSQLELDLMLEDIRSMYEKFRLIGQLNLQHQSLDTRKPSTPAPAATTEPAAAKPEPPVEKTVQPEPEAETSEKVTHETYNETVQEETAGLPAAADQRPAYQDSTPSYEAEHSTLAERYKSDQKSLGEVISAGSGQDEELGSRLGNTPVADLKSVIGLAEKFAFINELFGGDPLAYEKAIVQLNGSSRLAEAEAYLGTLRLNHRWPADSQMAGVLAEIVRRKFNQ